MDDTAQRPEQAKNLRQALGVLCAALLTGLPVILLWDALYPLNPAPDVPDIAMEMLYFLVTLILFSMLWRLKVWEFRLGGGLLLLGLFMDALADIFMSPPYVDIYFCQGLQIIGVALFAWGAYHHYQVLTEKIFQITRDLDHMEFQATHDMLTKIPNRLLFEDRLSQAIAHARRHGQKLAILYMDLDNMKEINDTLGHAAGDYVLKETAQILNKTIRGGDTVARLGGDEFAIIQTEVDTVQQAESLATKLQNAINNPLEYQQRQIVPNASFGISLFPTHGDNLDRLLATADAAMYKAKDAEVKPKIVVYDTAIACSTSDHHVRRAY